LSFSLFNILLSINIWLLPSQDLVNLKHERAAALRLLQRSTPAIFNLPLRSFSTSSKYGQSNKDSDNNNNKKPDDDDKNMQSMLAKAFMWMFTGYMLITLVSLMFPGGNQPEV